MSGTVPPNPQLDPATGAVIFNYQAWAARFPVLAQSIPIDVATGYFDEAAMYFNNTSGSGCQDPKQRQTILFLLTAHIATLYGSGGSGAAGGTGMVGRVSSATEGSVSVSSDMEGTAQSAWYDQTQFGASAYRLMRKYARVRYYPGPRPVFDPYPVSRIWPIR
jgi:Protein of unknown function (DUF4054)